MAELVPPRTFQGGILIVGSMAIIGLIDNLIPIIAKEASLWQFHTFRSFLGIPILILIILARGRRIMPLQPRLLIIRSAMLSSSMLLYFGTLALMPIAEAGTGLFASPIFVLIFSVIFFGIRIGIWRIAAVIAGFGGVLLVLKPDIFNLEFMILLPFLTAILYSGGQLMTRHYCSQEDTFVVLLMFYLVIGICGLIGILVFTIWPSPVHWQQQMPFFTTGWSSLTWNFLLWTTIQSLGSLVAVAGLIRGYQIGDPTYLGVFEYSFLLFAGFWGWVFWKHIPDFLAITGMMTIILSGTAIMLRSKGSRSI